MVRSTAISLQQLLKKRKTGIDIDARQTGDHGLQEQRCFDGLHELLRTRKVPSLPEWVPVLVKELRGKMYEKVMSFSDAEMNRFSTASYHQKHK